MSKSNPRRQMILEEDEPAGSQHPSGFAQSWAVVIGIDDYGHGIPPLDTAANDATAMALLLLRWHGYDVILLTDEDATQRLLDELEEDSTQARAVVVEPHREAPARRPEGESVGDGLPRLFLQGPATGEAMRDLLISTLPAVVTADDRLLFYYAGHGVTLTGEAGAQGPMGYLLPQTARPRQPETYLSMDQLLDQLDDLPCRHLLLILDSCFAGAVRWSSGRQGVRLRSPQELLGGQATYEHYQLYTRSYAWQAIASAAHNQTALDLLPGEAVEIGQRGAGDGGRHSPFAVSLLRALRGGKDKDTLLTATELFQHLELEVGVASAQEGHWQMPVLVHLPRHQAGQYVLLNPDRSLDDLKTAHDFIPENNPWRGPEAYDAEYADLFFGREEEIEALAVQVAEQPLTVVVGASGTGKSSLVKAGLVPRLAGSQEGGNSWSIPPAMQPGADPVGVLHELLKGQLLDGDEAASLERLWVDPEALAAWVAAWRQANKGRRLVLIVDEARELFTRCRDEAERRQFLALLGRALAAYGDCLRVVFTLRSSFETQLREELPLVQPWDDIMYAVPDMNRQGLLDVVERPTLRCALIFDSLALIDELVDEVKDMPGALALLSLALHHLYLQSCGSGRNDRTLMREDYRALGGVRGLVCQRADQEYRRLAGRGGEEAEGQEAMRRAMLRMVVVEGGELVRRPVPRWELVYPDEAENERVEVLLRQLIDARLLVEGVAHVEPAHDAMVRHWDRFLAWKGEAEEYLPLQRRLAQAAADWRPPDPMAQAGPLWNGDPRLPQLEETLWLPASERTGLVGRLKLARQWFLPNVKEPRHLAWLSRLELEFVQQSVKRRARGLRIVVTSVLVFIVAVSVLAAVARVQRNAAVREARYALSRQLAAQAVGPLGGDQPIEKSLLLAVEALRATKDAGLPHVVEADDALRRTLAAAPLAILRHEGGVNQTAFSPDGTRLATGSMEGTARLVDAASGRELVSLQHEGSVNSVTFSSDGARLATGSEDGNAYLVDAASGQVVTSLHHEGKVYDVAFSPDGAWLATGGEDGTVWVVDATSGQVQATLRHEAPIWDLTFSPGGMRLVASGLDGMARLWDSAGWRELVSLESEDWKVVFNADGTRLVTRGEYGIVYLVDAASGREVAALHHEGPITAVAFSPDGTHLLTGSTGGTVYLVEASSGQMVATLHHEGVVNAVAFSPDGTRLATACSDGTAQLWDATSGQEVAALRHDDWVEVVTFSPDGTRLATGSAGGTVYLVDAANGQEMASARHGGWVMEAVFSPDGRWLAIANREDTIYLWDAASGQERAILYPGSYINTVAFSPDGARLAIGNAVGAVYLVDVASGQELVTLHHEGGVGAVAFSPDGTRLATRSDDGIAYLLDATVGLEPITLRHRGRVKEVVFSPEGTRLATISEGGTVHLVEPANGQVLATQYSDIYVNASAFSPHGKRLAIGRMDGSAYLIDGVSGQELAVLRHEGYVTTLAFSPDGTRLATGSSRSPDSYLVDAVNGQVVASLRHEGSISRVAFSPDGTRLATGSSQSGDGTARLWDARSGQALATLGHEGDVWEIAFSPDGTRLTTCNGNATVWLWDAVSGEKLATLQHAVTIPEVAFSPDGTRLATAAGGGAFYLVDVATGQEVVTLHHEGGILDVAFSPDGKWLAFGGYDGTASLLDAASGQELTTLDHEGGVGSIVFSPDGTRLATGSDGGTVYLVDAAKGQRIATFIHEGPVLALVFSPDGTWLATGSEDGTTYLVDAARGKETAILHLEAGILAVAFSPDGTQLAAASASGNAYLWDVASGRELAILRHEGAISFGAFNGGGTRLVTGSDDGTARLWRVSTEELATLSCGVVSRNLTQAEWNQFIGKEVPYQCTCLDFPPGEGAPLEGCQDRTP